MKILIVDDEKEIADGIEFIINSAERDYLVVGKAHNGLEGLKLMREYQPDVVITDIRMPECDGLEMIQKAQAEGLDAGYIMLSGYAEFEYARRAMQYGVRFYLTKPLDEDEMFAALEQLRPKSVPEELLKKLDDAAEACDDDRCAQVTDEIMRLEPDEKLQKELILRCAKDLPAEQARAALAYNDMKQALRYLNGLRLGEKCAGEEDAIEKVKAYIRENFTGDISSADVAARFYINPAYFGQLFKRRTGKTYQSYVTELRMALAKKLLKDTDLRIYEIAERTGYGAARYFNTVFERETGVKPTEYRQKEKH